MLIDWVTARVPLTLLSPAAREAVNIIGDRVVCYCPRTGDVKYETSKWQSVRSDSHQISVRVGTDLWIQGSPARCIGNGCSVFGSGASAAMDLAGCVQRMVDYVSSNVGCDLPPGTSFIVSRVDVTGNICLPSLADVRQALAILRSCEGGRYRTSQQAGDTVYWSHRSKLRSGKAYAKGPHLEYLLKQKTYEGHQFTATELEKANHLLRLELKLGREWFSRNDWKHQTSQTLKAEWESYFMRMIGSAEMTDNSNLKQRVMANAPTEGQGKAAFGCWVMIQQQGWEAAQEFYSRTTWYRNMKVLRKSGLGDADISLGQIVPIRRKVIEAQIVNNWSEIAA